MDRAEWVPEKVVAAFDAELITICGVEPITPASHAGHGATYPRSRPVSPSRSKAREACAKCPTTSFGHCDSWPNHHGAALVFDEIQCGMGRTGSFLASAKSGVRADYYLLSKSLGGGLAKISALLVQAGLSVDDFGRHHTSTFAEDELSAEIALAAIDLLSRITPMIAETGERLGDKLAEFATRWPDVVKEARGRGLLHGLELAPVRQSSKLLGDMLGGDSLGYVVAGYLLHKHGIRVLPTLSALTTLRIQPSAFLSDLDIDRLVAALDATADLLRRRDFATLMSHLALPAQQAWQPPRAAMQPSRCVSVRCGGKRRSDAGGVLGESELRR